MAVPDWAKIKNAYITGSISYKELAKKYNISMSTLAQRAKRENWPAKKEKAINTLVNKTIRKTIDKKADRQAAIFTKELRATELILDKIIATLEDENQFNKHLCVNRTSTGKQFTVENEFSVVDAKRLQALSDTLTKNTLLKKVIKGILDVKDKEQIDINRERLELEKQKLELERMKAVKDDNIDTEQTIIEFADSDIEEASG